ncbi:MAG: RES family NAD+ phosphorylase [Burkholderiales bacterium]
MRVYRASRKPRAQFDPRDSSASVARDGWRYNDNRTEILYASEVEALAILEIVARPGWETVVELNVAAIEVPDGSIVNLSDLAITLPSNWNQRPAARNAQRIGAEFLMAVDRARPEGRTVCGLRVPSVISKTDHNVLLDPRQKSAYRIVDWSLIPFDWLIATST